MTDYIQIYDNVDAWYDSLNDAHEHAFDVNNKAIVYPRFNRYLYAYLSCIEEFSDDHE